MEQTHILAFIGLSLLFSLITGRGATQVKVPLIIGYIIAGAILGPAIIGFVGNKQVNSLAFINTLTLSLIGFNVGSELRFRELRKMGKKIMVITVFEASVAFIVTGIATALVLRSIPMGIIYGALACATAPAGTIDVIRQYQAKGELTSTLFAVMGLDDIYALILYSIGIPLAGIMLGSHEVSVSVALLGAVRDIGLELGIGAAIGYLMAYLGRFIHEQSLFLVYSLGALFLMCALASVYNISPILLTMSAAIVMTNRNGIVTRKLAQSLTQWSAPVYLMFFVLLGSRLDFGIIASYSLLIIAYIIFRTIGKFGGAFYGSRLAGASPKVQNYLGFTLLSQAGVAIGLSLGAANILSSLKMDIQAKQVISVMTASTFLIMLVGPVLVKYGLSKAGELHVKE